MCAGVTIGKSSSAGQRVKTSIYSVSGLFEARTEFEAISVFQTLCAKLHANSKKLMSM